MAESVLKATVVAGTRPNFIKIASLMREFKQRARIQTRLIHTGQHYHRMMSDSFFSELEIPPPQVELGVGSGSHAEQTAQILIKMEKVLRKERPDLTIVVGDVNSTLAAALASVQLRIPISHVEAGLRSFDRSMPEEINRLLTDAIADQHFTSEQSANENLRREGISEDQIHFVGNVMIDTLLYHRNQAQSSKILNTLGLEARPGDRARKYALMTLHRPSNVDHLDTLKGILEAALHIGREIPVIFPCHPRTQKQLENFQVLEGVKGYVNKAGLCVLEPLGYLDFLRLMNDAAVVLTDSGGIQEETTALGVPCLTLRKNTERPVTVEQGTNRLVGNEPERILAAYAEIQDRGSISTRIPDLWDGLAAKRIADILERK